MIGIIGAMEEEVAALKSEMADAKVTEFASMTFYKGTLCGKDTVVVRSGIGKVNAAICAQILVDKFGVDTLINTGIAGSLDARIDIGDMVMRYIMIWTQLYLEMRSGRCQEWIRAHSRQIRIW
mgnify:CR=1 FL=1